MELLAAYSHLAQVVELRGFATPWLSSAQCALRPNAKRPWDLRERLDEREIANLIITYRAGVTVV